MEKMDHTLDMLRSYMSDDDAFDYYVNKSVEREVAEQITQFLMELRLPKPVYQSGLVNGVQGICKAGDELEFSLAPIESKLPTVRIFSAEYAFFHIDPSTGLITCHDGQQEDGTLNSIRLRYRNGWRGSWACLKWRPGYEETLPGWIKELYPDRLSA